MKKYTKAFAVLISIMLIMSGCGKTTSTDTNAGVSSESEAENIDSSVDITSDTEDSETVDINQDADDASDNSDTHNSDASSTLDCIDDTFPRATPEEVGLHNECFKLVEDVIKTDIEYGFTSAELSVIKDGKLVYEGAWGKLNSYNQDGSVCETSPDVNVDTMYDLASVSKMFGVNYALQKLVTEGKISLDDKVKTYLGPGFSDAVIDIQYEDGDNPGIETQKEWKSNLTLRNLLMHQGGFPADPRYFNPHLDTEKQKFDQEKPNLLYAGSGADAATKEATIAAICKTPLLYQPGTRTLYSDVDYMILGVVIESVTGVDLDTYIKQNFCEPMGLKHITYTPLEHGFSPSDCAATELNGNTRDNLITFENIRDYTLQGEVHDEKAYYSMGGISGHAGLFGSATDVAILSTLMLGGEFNGERYFSQEVIDNFTGPKSEEVQNWGLGWWRQGNTEWPSYFGTKASSSTIGHQGWTGTFVMIDPENNMIIVLLTNKINTPVTDKDNEPNTFNGDWYTTARPGFVADILYTGMDQDVDVTEDLQTIKQNLADKAREKVTDDMPDNHPAVRNLNSKLQILSE